MEHGMLEPKGGQYGASQTSTTDEMGDDIRLFKTRVIGYHMDKTLEMGKILSMKPVRKLLQYRAEVLVASLFL